MLDAKERGQFEGASGFPLGIGPARVADRTACVNQEELLVKIIVYKPFK